MATTCKTEKDVLKHSKWPKNRDEHKTFVNKMPNTGITRDALRYSRSYRKLRSDNVIMTQGYTYRYKSDSRLAG